ncbi:hypothetical protein ORI89_13210 [Sphingobacterium sp. UT-1RO-CII-1]|uniref:hypothetical protein n=1 Tax=Sphingobacterium sp. UT-1RO-CII-1 TaxID=2995225 RepID=UPI00227AD212|nr:hypothetical protein [Sphingobacterium sp. UT-1RO-CII-1]MCY4780612.1 hypothetical protein [Sphingobacterium sp. UT-1RO-CII-1]
MKTTTFIIFLAFLSLLVRSQERQYYEFVWNGLYGVTDVKGKETLEPSYEEKVACIHDRSPYLALSSKDKSAYIIHTVTGEREILNLLDNRLLSIGNDDYMYAHLDDKSFLINNFDLENRKLLPKKYEEVQLFGDYLVGITKDEINEFTVDVLSKVDFEIKRVEQKVIDFKYYRQSAGGHIYLITKHDTTIVYDDNLQQIASTTDKLIDFASIQDYLSLKLNINIVDRDGRMEGAMTGSLPGVPLIRPSTTVDEGEYVTYDILQSADDYIPFFRIKSDRSRFYQPMTERGEDKFEGWSRKGAGVALQFFFHIDVKQKAILLPQRYWSEIDLQLLL